MELLKSVMFIYILGVVCKGIIPARLSQHGNEFDDVTGDTGTGSGCDHNLRCPTSLLFSIP